MFNQHDTLPSLRANSTHVLPELGFDGCPYAEYDPQKHITAELKNENPSLHLIQLIT